MTYYSPAKDADIVYGNDKKTYQDGIREALRLLHQLDLGIEINPKVTEVLARLRDQLKNELKT